MANIIRKWSEWFIVEHPAWLLGSSDVEFERRRHPISGCRAAPNWLCLFLCGSLVA
jgi:hypothetical protein